MEISFEKDFLSLLRQAKDNGLNVPEIEDPQNFSNIEKYFNYSFFDFDLTLELLSFAEHYNSEKFKEFFSKEITNQEDFRKHIFENNPLTEPIKEFNILKRELVKNPYEENKGLYKCRNKKCGSMNTVGIQMQTRSADEPMTVFIYCLVCRETHT